MVEKISHRGTEEQKIDQIQCIHRIFEERAREQPEAIALTFAGKHMNYAELNRRANRIAHYLQKQHIGPDCLVGLCLEQSFELVISILGILKSGAAYVPLDPHYPEQRLALMIEDAQMPLLITQETYRERFLSYSHCQTLSLEQLDTTLEQENEQNPQSAVESKHLAYVIYTSGSTGRPKGVLISHYNITRLFTATEHWFHFHDKDVWTLFHSSAFDLSVWEMWGALAYGGRLVIVPYLTGRSFEQFYALVMQEKVTILTQTPTAFKQFMLADEMAGPRKQLDLRFIVFAGEALNIPGLRSWFERHGDRIPRLVNMYGITETTVHVTYREITYEDTKNTASVIGEAIPDLQVYILDEHLCQVPVGSIGEIYVGGLGVGQGYLKQPQLTQERFIAHSFSQIPGDRLYKSGDLATPLANGDIQYIGRADFQIKIRGFRIEPGEVENALLAHVSIKEAIVVVQDQMTDNPKIVAYIIPTHEGSLTLKELRQFLKKLVPDYMLPNAVVPLQELPITASGKLDRKQLPWPVKTPVAQRDEKALS